jgi:NCS1 family nucleobase:cation symporter-1
MLALETRMVEQATGLKAGWVPIVATVAFGAMLFGLASGSMVTLVRSFIGRYGLPLVIASLAWLTVQFVGTAQALPGGLSAVLSRTGDGSMSTVAAIDLVMAMPVSWLPLVADYARHGRLAGPDGRGGRSAFAGTLLGIFVANVWCYGLGVLVVSVHVKPPRFARLVSGISLGPDLVAPVGQQVALDRR